MLSQLAKHACLLLFCLYAVAPATAAPLVLSDNTTAASGLGPEGVPVGPFGPFEPEPILLGNFEVAVPFQSGPTASLLTTVLANMTSTSGLPPDLFLYSDFGGNPGTELAQLLGPVSPLPSTFQETDVALYGLWNAPTNTLLTPNTDYWILAFSPTAGNIWSTVETLGVGTGLGYQNFSKFRDVLVREEGPPIVPVNGGPQGNQQPVISWLLGPELVIQINADGVVPELDAKTAFQPLLCLGLLSLSLCRRPGRAA